MIYSYLTINITHYIEGIKSEEKPVEKKESKPKRQKGPTEKLTFEDLDEETLKKVQEKFTEKEWNFLSREDQDLELKCLK